MDNKQTYQLTLQLKDSLSAPLTEIRAGLEAFNGTISQLAGATTSLTESFQLSAASLVALASSLTTLTTAQSQLSASSAASGGEMQLFQNSVDNMKMSLFNATGAMGPYLSLMADIIPVVDSTISIFNALGLAQKLAAVGTALLSGAQLVLNSIFNGNPLGLIITGLTAFGILLVEAYRNSQSFRDGVEPLMEVLSVLGDIIKNFLISALVSVCTLMAPFADFFQNVATAIQEYFIIALTAAYSTIAPLVDMIKGLLGIEDDAADSATQAAQATGELAGANDKAAEATGKLAGANDKAVPSVNKLADSVGQQNRQLNLNLSTLGGIEQKISTLKAAQKSASLEQAIALEKEIRLWQSKQEEMKNAIIIGNAQKPEMKLIDAPALPTLAPRSAKDAAENPTGLQAPSTKGLGEELDDSKKKVTSFTDSIWGSDSVIGQWANNATSNVTRIKTSIQEFGSMLANDTLNGLQKTTGGMQAMGAMMSTMGGMVDGAAGSWLSWGANLLGAIAGALPQLLELFGVQCAVAAASAATSVASIPVVGWIMAGVAVASVLAALATIPKPKAMAQGGIVYGNTFAQVGEYPGAANNPEVVAPLNKLRQLIQPAGGFGGGTVEFVIKGNRLVGVLNKEGNKNRYF